MPVSDNKHNELMLINLLIEHKVLAQEWFENNNPIDMFHPDNRIVMRAIEYYLSNNEKLTRKGFQMFLENFVPERKNRISSEQAFNVIQFQNVEVDDFSALKTSLIDRYLRQQTSQIIRRYDENIKQKGSIQAVQTLSENILDLTISTEQRKRIIYESITDYSNQHLTVMASDDDDSDLLKCGIKEIDDSMPNGFERGTLTLFSGDVGAFKTTTMLNVGLNVWKEQNKNVLFVPLEMPRPALFQKILSRETEIPFAKLRKKKNLTEEEWAKVVEVTESWKDAKSRFFIMEAEDRTKVSAIRREIERHINAFHPRIVVVDYIANLVPDQARSDRNDLEIGDMLKSLRHMGRHMGFAIVSAAQLGREALKKIKQSGDKYVPSSTDLRGSHEYSADADDIFAMIPDPQQPSLRLNLYRIKSRYGDKQFANGHFKATLEVRPEISLVRSLDQFETEEEQDDILAIAEDADIDELVFNEDKGGDGLADIEDW